MQRGGAATRGAVARPVAGAAAIAIKATVPDRQIKDPLACFGLTTRNDEGSTGTSRSTPMQVRRER